MRPDCPRLSLLRGGALGAVALLAVLAACDARLPTADEVSHMDVSAAERVASPLLARTPAAGPMTYTINGVAATEEQANAIPPERISSIIMEQRLGVGAHPVIQITTRDAALASRSEAEHVSIGTVQMRKRASLQGLDSEGAARPTGMLRYEQTLPAPLFIINGVRANPAAMRNIAPGDITSVEVLKGAAAAKLYGAPATRAGVIRISTRHAAAM